MCNCFNTIYTRWENFTPELPMEIVLAKHIRYVDIYNVFKKYDINKVNGRHYVL